MKALVVLASLLLCNAARAGIFECKPVEFAELKSMKKGELERLRCAYRLSQRSAMASIDQTKAVSDIERQAGQLGNLMLYSDRAMDLIKDAQSCLDEGLRVGRVLLNEKKVSERQLEASDRKCPAER